MNKLWTVTLQTYWHQVKSWSFLILILGPFFIIGCSALGGAISANSDSESQIAVISSNEQVRQNFIKNNDKYVDSKIKTVESAKKAVKKEKIDGYLVFGMQKNQVKAVYHGASPIADELKPKVKSYLQMVQSQFNLQQAQLAPHQLKALQQQPQYTEVLQKNHQDDKLVKMLSLIIVIMAVYMILISYSGITAQEIASEKGTKIMEIIFSSTTAAKYFLGKILGIFGVIVTQLIIYIVGGWATYRWALYAKITASFMRDNQVIINKVLGNLLNVNLIFLILGVVIYTILAAFSGALVAKPEDSSKAAQSTTMISLIAFFLAFAFISHPEQILPQVLSYVPFFSSFMMPIRIINGQVGSLEVILSLVILIVSIIGLTIYISKIYQGVILQTDDTSFWKRLKRGLSYSRL
ncbi:ABC transporter permease [Bombilactobacillus mellis]|uniref:ABC transporter permease n=1 Tax=Bombilactobacillus mellis TaxID=1218508 RepID=UPI0022477637|nr:ABC transporter permease [Bombilactobacillus mellis]MCX0279799.1 ABC transporter permease [Bombilactobacillus mellis]